MKKVFALCLAVALSSPLFAQNPIHIGVNGGDVEALRDAINTANSNPQVRTDIVLTGDFHFREHYPLPPIETEVTIGAYHPYYKIRFLGPKEGDEQAEHPITLLHVAQGGSLSVSNVEINGIDLMNDGRGLILNEGELNISRVIITDVTGYGYCSLGGSCVFTPPVIRNDPTGHLVMDTLSIVNTGARQFQQFGGVLGNEGRASITNTQLYLNDPKFQWYGSFSNRGTLEINNSTFFYTQKTGHFMPKLFSTIADAETTIMNSIVANFDGATCDDATSLGFNLNSESACNWSATEDKTGANTGLMWRSVDADWGYSYPKILTHAFVPSATSLAIDSANPETCERFDLLGAARISIDDQCDRGAVEALPAGLGEGGINGLYFNPEADGHYIQIMQTDYLTLVIWNTFDLEGNHVWVYGTGQLVNGTSLVAETYINRDTIVLPDVPVVDAETEYWGTLEVDMFSCTEGTIAFDSVFPEFGSGQFPITRLAYVKQIGCVE